MTASITLSRKQVTQLAEIANHFTEIDDFTLEVDHSSGIGVGIRVTFDLLKSGKKDTAVDITDVTNW